jgi:hypothetical protein
MQRKTIYFASLVVLLTVITMGGWWYFSNPTTQGQDAAKVELTWKYLNGIGLIMEQMAFDMTAPDLQQAVAQDLSDANTLGVSQTPEYFVNARPMPSFGFQQLQQRVAE